MISSYVIEDSDRESFFPSLMQSHKQTQRDMISERFRFVSKKSKEKGKFPKITEREGELY